MEMQRNFSTNIKTLRALYHKSLEEFSEDLGIGKSTLQEIEHGVGNPTLSTVSQVARALDLSPIELLCGQYHPAEFRAAQVVLPFINAFQYLDEVSQQRAEKILSELLFLFRPAFEEPRTK